MLGPNPDKLSTNVTLSDKDLLLRFDQKKMYPHSVSEVWKEAVQHIYNLQKIARF